ncbi:MAG: hypothetical protein WD604_09340 [Balneolaceae bacterium]
MEFANASQLYWFISVGLAVGFTVHLIIRNEGISLWGNLIWGVIGAIFAGTMGLYFNLGDGVLFSFIGTLLILFDVNVFHQHHVEDLLGEEPPGAHT